MPKRISSIKPREDFRRGKKQLEKSNKWCISLFAKLIIMAILIASAFIARISFIQKAELMNREVSRVEREIHQINREIENLKKRKAELTSFANVCKQNKRGELGLRYAAPSQVRKVALLRRNIDTNDSFAAQKTVQKKTSRRTASIR